jgi:REP element-mobilizing transposase RayT
MLSQHMLAKPAKVEYRRKLPHIQVEAKSVFVTFCTCRRWEMPESVRGLVLKHCLHDHKLKLQVHGVVVMPDHVRLVFTPLADTEGNTFSLAEILVAIKGASAHRINQALKRRGKVWQTESFDHILRTEEKIREKVEYICQNPIRKGIGQSMDEYPWLWREWEEGLEENPPPTT